MSPEELRKQSANYLFRESAARPLPVVSSGNSEPARTVEIEDLPRVSDIAAATVPYLVAGLIPEGGITMFTGEAGSGKSTIATAILGHVSCGAPFAGLDVQRRECLILDRENPAAVVNARLRWLGVDDRALHFWGGWLESEAPDPLGASVLRWVEKTDPRPLILIDTLSPFLGDADENSASEVRAFLHRCRTLANMGCTVIILHHSGKGETSKTYRGSSAIKGELDAGFLVENLSSDLNRLDRVRLSAWKRRVPLESPILLDWSESDGLWTRRETTVVEDSAETLTRLLRGNPGISRRKLADLSAPKNVSRTRTYAWLDGEVLKRRIEEHAGRGSKAARLYLVREDAPEDE